MSPLYGLEVKFDDSFLIMNLENSDLKALIIFKN